MANVDDKRRAADVRPVGIRRPNTEILAEFDSRQPGGEQPVHLIFLDAGVGQGVLCRLGVELECRFLRHDADLVGLIHPNDGYFPSQCIHSPFRSGPSPVIPAQAGISVPPPQRGDHSGATSHYPTKLSTFIIAPCPPSFRRKPESILLIHASRKS